VTVPSVSLTADVVLMLGQSNMDGRGAYANWIPLCSPNPSSGTRTRPVMTVKEALMTSGGSLAVSVSENGSDWQTVANGVGSDATTSVDFGTQTARLRPY